MPHTTEKHGYQSVDIRLNAICHRRHKPYEQEQHERKCQYRNGYYPARCHQHDNQQNEPEIQIGSDCCLAVSTKRNIEVVLEPRRQRNVPARPEFGTVFRLVRRVEVLAQAEAHQQGNTYCNVGIAREVAVQLQRISEHRHQRLEASVHVGICKHAVDKVDCNIVANHNLLYQAFQYHKHSRAKLVACKRIFLVNLRHKLRRTDNRSGNQLREKRHIESKVDYALHWLKLTSVNVYGVGHCLEGVERNSNRQEYFRQVELRTDQHIRQSCKVVCRYQMRTEHRIEGIDEEKRVFEI